MKRCRSCAGQYDYNNPGELLIHIYYKLNMMEDWKYTGKDPANISKQDIIQNMARTITHEMIHFEQTGAFFEPIYSASAKEFKILYMELSSRVKTKMLLFKMEPTRENAMQVLDEVLKMLPQMYDGYAAYPPVKNMDRFQFAELFPECMNDIEDCLPKSDIIYLMRLIESCGPLEYTNLFNDDDLKIIFQKMRKYLSPNSIRYMIMMDAKNTTNCRPFLKDTEKMKQCIVRYNNLDDMLKFGKFR
jgi:hypothetical protein